MSFIYVLRKKRERIPATFIVSLVKQKPGWRSHYSLLLMEHSSKVSCFSKHLKRGASHLGPAVTFRERGTEAAVSCLD